MIDSDFLHNNTVSDSNTINQVTVKKIVSGV